MEVVPEETEESWRENGGLGNPSVELECFGSVAFVDYPGMVAGYKADQSMFVIIMEGCIEYLLCKDMFEDCSVSH